MAVNNCTFYNMAAIFTLFNFVQCTLCKDIFGALTGTFQIFKIFSKLFEKKV